MGLCFPPQDIYLLDWALACFSGVGSMFYCFGLDYLPVSLVVTLSNLYIVVTLVLSIVILHEPVTVLKICGFIAILAGVLVLARPPARHTANPEACPASTPVQRRGLAITGIYIVMSAWES